jgi:hypothetical protein
MKEQRLILKAAPAYVPKAFLVYATPVDQGIIKKFAIKA